MLLSATEIIEDFRGGSREKRVPGTCEEIRLERRGVEVVVGQRCHVGCVGTSWRRMLPLTTVFMLSA